jgi:hypothetical protein
VERFDVGFTGDACLCGFELVVDPLLFRGDGKWRAELRRGVMGREWVLRRVMKRTRRRVNGGPKVATTFRVLVVVAGRVVTLAVFRVISCSFNVAVVPSFSRAYQNMTENHVEV